MESGTIVFAVIALAISTLNSDTAPPPTAAEINFAPGNEARAVARIVGGIISYTRWPTQVATLRLCVTGTARHAAQLGDASTTAGRAISVQTIDAGAATTGCDILYIGKLPAPVREQTIRALRGRGVLSIAESDPRCRDGTMVCLRVAGSSATFQLNLDAVSRGTVRIDPRVLLVAAGRAS